MSPKPERLDKKPENFFFAFKIFEIFEKNEKFFEKNENFFDKNENFFDKNEKFFDKNEKKKKFLKFLIKMKNF